MKIALDFDSTYTLDPDSWNKFIETFKNAGHQIYCVTMRYDNDDERRDVVNSLHGKVDNIIFTGRKSKLEYVASRGIKIDVWIDDNPL